MLTEFIKTTIAFWLSSKERGSVLHWIASSALKSESCHLWIRIIILVSLRFHRISFLFSKYLNCGGHNQPPYLIEIGLTFWSKDILNLMLFSVKSQLYYILWPSHNIWTIKTQIWLHKVLGPNLKSWFPPGLLLLVIITQ